MTLRMGTRTLQTERNEHPSSAGFDRSLSSDPGMSKRVTTSLTFTASNGRVTGANHTFDAFAVGDPILIEGTNLNNGERIITAIGGTNSFLVLDYPPQNEGPLTATVRTP